MSAQNGSLKLDGLIEGPIPPFPDGGSALQDWVRGTREQGLTFHLSIDGPAFSLLPDSSPLRSTTDGELQEKIAASLRTLLAIYPGELHGRIFSTLRSSHLLSDTEVQSIYAISSRGLDVQERRVPRTTSIDPTPTGIDSRKLILFGGGALVLLIGLVALAYWLGFGRLWSALRDQQLPVDAERIALDTSPVDKYLHVERKDRVSTLELTITRKKAFPVDLAAVDATEKAARDAGDLRGLLALEKLVVDGSLRFEFLDADGNHLVSREIGIRELLDQESTTKFVSLRGIPKLAKVRLSF